MAITGLWALVAGVWWSRPLGTPAIAFDSQAAVLHFRRILEGVRIETFIPTTPKPLLTAVFGTLYGLTGDWRSLAIATLVAFAVAVVLGTALAIRAGGPVAGLVAGIALAVAPSLMFDVGFSLATPWAAIGWFAAGLAATSRKPRYGWAGLALALATLARVETLVLTGTILAALAITWTFASVAGRPELRPPSRAWLVPVIALAALPVMLLHDWRLTGDPLFWTTVARRYTEHTSLHIMSAREVVRLVVIRYREVLVLSLLAVCGVVALIRRRDMPLLIGLAGLGPGVAAFLVYLAASGIFVSDRYLAAVDVAVAFAAGIGVGAIASWLVTWWRVRRPIRRGPDLVGGAVGLAGLALTLGAVVVSSMRVEPGLPEVLANARRLASDAHAAVPVLAQELEAATSGRPAVGPIILVPGPVWPRLVVDLGSLATVVVTTDYSKIDVAAGYPAPGQVVFHSVAGDPASGRWSQLEVSVPTAVDGVIVDPIESDPASGVWIVRIEKAP